MEEYLVPLQIPCVYHDSLFLSEMEATEAYQDLLKNTPWEKTPKINRWVSLMELPKRANSKEGSEDSNKDGKSEEGEEEGSGYRYRDAPGASHIGFPPTVYKLKRMAEEWYNSKINEDDDDRTDNVNEEGFKRIKVEFNVCLLNYYQDGHQRIGWHSDREEIGRSTPIASISLGATRQFLLRSKTDGVHDRYALKMRNGCLVVMENVCQYKYLHSVPRESEVTEGRINLTFRCKQPSDDKTEGTTAGELEHERRDHWIQQISSEAGALDSTAGAWQQVQHTQINKHGNNENVNVNEKDTTNFVPRGNVFGDHVQFDDPSSTSSLSRKCDYFKISVQYVVKTNLGAECYCAAEVEEVLGIKKFIIIARPFGIAGYVACFYRQATHTSYDSDTDGEDEQEIRSKLEATLLRLRTAHHVLRYHDHFDLNDVIDFLASYGKSETTPKMEVGETGTTNDKTACNVDIQAQKTGVTTAPPKIEQTNGENTKKKESIDGESLYQFYKQRLVTKGTTISSLKNLGNGKTFRVSSERIGGPHGFQGPEVEREVGGALSEYYTHIRPKMSNYDIHIRVDVISSKVLVGTQINVDDLSKERHFLRFRNAVTIKTNLAYAMIRCADLKGNRGNDSTIRQLLVDPFCGSGTILLEALDTYKENISCVGMDVSRRSANGARENALAENVGSDVCEFYCCDARNIRKHLKDESVDAIVTNLPWGIMTGHKNVSDLQSMYEVFLRTAWYVLKDRARIVMLVLRGLQLTRIIRKLSGRYRLLSVNVVRTTNNLPSLVVVEKLAVDEVRVAVKRQLAYLAQFVNVSSEMYNAVHYEKIDESNS